ncbi:MAG: hypothetical protein GYB66_09930 [Chloroflexi bacterium]|nr:hypothetical protein [Chloroflexota bacterium]
MDIQTIAVILAIVGLVATIGYFVLGYRGIKALEAIRDRLGNDKNK